jgi:hypothetical protein
MRSHFGFEFDIFFFWGCWVKASNWPKPTILKCRHLARRCVDPMLRKISNSVPYAFGLLDPDPDPLVRGMDPDPSIIMQK